MVCRWWMDRLGPRCTPGALVVVARVRLIQRGAAFTRDLLAVGGTELELAILVGTSLVAHTAHRCAAKAFTLSGLLVVTSAHVGPGALRSRLYAPPVRSGLRGPLLPCARYTTPIVQ